ncbi:hypothetical protein CFOL_v3_28717 [Cephalotus follicularis]|uniref:Uncharacterized protein n=1 Tax=Cephalotus follicularis TaxID=3775 RepID=A0A1Q3CYI8_CEPFO|nr:hypothetical protein CFOL_v3_28717 [Cephalotus follicularis]
MPGNEVGDRIHNFFGQENLSQGQHHSQVVDGTWPGLSNNLWVGNHRQIGAPLISNLKNYNIQQLADSERGHSGQSSSLQHGMNFTQLPLRPEFTRSQSQNQQPTLNGYVHGHQGFQTRQNEANFLGVDTESDRRNLISRGFSVHGSQLENGPQLKENSVRLESTESPVNYDFFGGQQQLSGQHPGMMQPLPRQQSDISDMHLLQQQVMFKQMQEFQRQQRLQKSQFQQQEERRLSSLGPVSSTAKQAVGNHSPPMNVNPINDASNYSLQPELMAANTNWLQCGASPVMQGSSSGLMFSPEQGQALRLMGMVPQQVGQSLYGVPVTSTWSVPTQHSAIQMDKPAMQQVTANSNFPGNQYVAFPDQVSLQDGGLVSRQGYQEQNMFGPAAGQSLNSRLSLENLQKANPQQRNAPVQEFCDRQELAGPSGTSHEKMGMQVPPSQNVATLDPTEEKILFGSDDNLWDSFGRATDMGSGGFNVVDTTDPFGAFPSVQSGSWSALMQSAVAETSGSDIGPQEEWSGLSVRDGEIPTRNQPSSSVNDGSKQQTVWALNILQPASAPNSRPFPLPDDANTSLEYRSVSDVQKPGSKTSHEQGEMLQTNSSQGFPQKLPEEGSKWLDRSSLQKPVAGHNSFYGNIVHSSDAEQSVKSIAGSYTQRQGMPSYNPGGQPGKGTNGWNFIESESPGGGSTLHPSQCSNHQSSVHEEVGRVKPSIGSPQANRKDSDFNNVMMSDSRTIRSKQESSQQHPDLNNLNFWKNPDSVNSRGSGLPGNYQHHLDKRPQIESLGNNGSDKGMVEIHELGNINMKENSSESSRSNVSLNPSTGGLRENVWLDATDSRTLPGGKQKSSGQISRKPPVTRKFQYHPMGDVGVDVEPSYGTKQVAHPQAMPQQVTQGFKGHEHGYFGLSKFLGHFTRNSIENEKGHSPGFQGETRGFDEVPSKSLHPGRVPGTSAPFDRSVGNYAPNKTAPSSQNMLELLHKVDQSGSATHVSSSDRNQSSETREAETSDASVGHIQLNQTSASQGFGLQLGPPSQRSSVPDHALISQSSSQMFNSQSTTHINSEGGKSQSCLPSTAPVQSLPPSREMSLGELENNISGISGQAGSKALQYNIQGNFSAAFPSSFTYSRSPLQNQHMTSAPVASQSVNLSFDRSFSQLKQSESSCERSQTSESAVASVPDMSIGDPHHGILTSAEISQSSINNQNHARDSLQQFNVLETMPVSQHSVTPGTSQQGLSSKILPNVWTSVSAQQRSLAVKPSSLYKSHLQPNNSVETTSGPQNLDDQVVQRGGNASSEFGACSANSQGYGGKEQPAKEQQESPGKNGSLETMSAAHSVGNESAVQCSSDASPLNPSATQRDIEAFGRSLRPNNVMNQRYSLLHQVQAMRNTENDPGNRSAKKFKGPDSGPDAQLVAPKGGQQLSYGSNSMDRNASTNLNSIPSADSGMLSFSSKPLQNIDTNASSHDMVAFSQNDSQSFSSSTSASVVRGEHSQISPQMAPSWFDQYGAFRNGHMLPMYDARKITTVKTLEQPLFVGRPSDSLHAHHSAEQVNAAADACQLGNSLQSSSPTTIAHEHMSPDQSMVTLRPKKRKIATSELLPWHREVMQGSQRLQSLSVAEVEWAQAANRLIEKAEDEAELIEDGSPLFRSKRRLILTTQLMQQLLRPPPSVILTADASTEYESVAYFTARSVLGDACSTVSCPGSEAPLPPKGGNLLHEKVKTNQRIGDQYIIKAMEDFVCRAKKLESDVLRLDKRASILDLRVECQDLEKYSVINRFAKFHGRGQADVAETSSSDGNANTQKSCPQRYVAALPMPRNLPDRVQCLSL